MGVLDIDVVVLRWWKKNKTLGDTVVEMENRSTLHPFKQKVRTIHTPKKWGYFRSRLSYPFYP